MIDIEKFEKKAASELADIIISYFQGKTYNIACLTLELLKNRIEYNFTYNTPLCIIDND